ncbi:hypothetical protein MIT9_P1476 [Methylomarinovum caldicuralii]|uniref:Ferritin-like domain-containing protein n=1 Tax=Methylomarinovum caldicuralii TaxID=438856 RepID=A0AAU9C409_9GAMM|nr:ferritin-like domain-containing protein [Methylomarinovum caldicuralii]BCX81894.1 hypothetical protein MIT9_P1476 [Methylomarinovum caldicuralii]
MENVFELAGACLRAPDLAGKLALTRRARTAFEAGRLNFREQGNPPAAHEVRMPRELSFVEPRRLPKRKLTHQAGRIALLHAVAHIEFSAILMHWDSLCRFRGMPAPYYHDWFTVVLEELKHFELLTRRLAHLGAQYGDLPVHQGLWQVALDTAGDVLARMALVPRFQEARGLDVTPGMIAGLRQAGDEESAAVLEVILDEEVGHVAKGDRWFRWLCRQQNKAPGETYLDLVRRHLRGAVRGPFNRPLRLQAGFDAVEMDRLETLQQGAKRCVNAKR